MIYTLEGEKLTESDSVNVMHLRFYWGLRFLYLYADRGGMAGTSLGNYILFRMLSWVVAIIPLLRHP